MTAPLLSTAYWPPVEWFAQWIRAGEAQIESQETIQKQSYRNRCRILSQHGVQELIIPLDRTGSKEIKKIQLSSREDWWRVHWKAIETAYSNAPFFAALQDDIQPIYSGDRPDTLWEWNLQIIEVCRKWLEIDFPLRETLEFSLEAEADFRQIIHPKKELTISPTPYKQVFHVKNGKAFVPGLSILDLILNEGPSAFSNLLGFE